MATEAASSRSKILLRIAQKLRDASHGHDYDDLNPEGAFNAAIWAVIQAIEESLFEDANNPCEE